MSSSIRRRFIIAWPPKWAKQYIFRFRSRPKAVIHCLLLTCWCRLDYLRNACKGTQKIDDLLVFHLREVLVELPDGEERLWAKQADDFVAQLPDLPESIRRSDRDGDDQLAR